MSVHIQVPGMRWIYPQPSSLTCWATCYTMMTAWNRGQRWATIDAAITNLGQPWLSMFRSNLGIPPAQGTAFQQAAGLVREPRQNLSARGWQQKLSTHGLLWVSSVIAGVGIHDRILEGISGDETGDGTFVGIMDPNGGRRYTQTLREFSAAFEAQAAVEPFNADYQILHF